ncbi:uncharacterized protein LOC134203355, partial [Armigeres subalbatus]|uniref:uncharacterized protein LOC134203355 n=1 Tax=Armigeres subalbatus TaxID=124917 RepID=UPI002ED59063
RRTTTTTTTKASTVRPTYPVPNGDNKNPDYTQLFRPSISMTKYPSYKPPKTIIIQEAGAGAGTKQQQVEPSVRMASVADPGQANDYQYSNEEDYLE